MPTPAAPSSKSGRPSDDPSRIVQLQAYAVAVDAVEFGPPKPEEMKVTFAYLGDVARDEVTRLGTAKDIEYSSFSGTAPAAPPGDQGFWVASAEGAGTQTVTWDVAAGEWSAEPGPVAPGGEDP